MSQIAAAERPRRLGAGLTAASLAASMVLWSGLATAAPAPESFADLAKEVSPAVVNIASTQEIEGPGGTAPGLPFDVPEGTPFEEFFKQFRDQFGNNGPQGAPPRRATGLGSGFIIDPEGYVVTNNHVVDGASRVEVRLEDESIYPAEVVGTDPQTDLALLKIEAEKPLPALRLGDSDTAEVGDWVMAVGNPFGLGGTVTAGIISARGRNIQAGPYDDFLQVDASINQGNSGGPLFDLEGDVIGVNTAIFSPNGGSVGIGFATPSNMVKSVVAQLREKGMVERGWLGVQIQNVTPDLANALGLEEAAGAIVAQVTPGSPAETGGIRSGDVILSFAGEKIDDSRELARVVAEHPVGGEADVRVWRDGEAQTLTFATARMPAPDRMASAPSQNTPGGAYHSSSLNAELASLTPERREQLGLDPSVEGVVVLDIKESSVLDQGLQAGDVVRRVGDVEVKTPQQLEAQFEQAQKESREALLMLVNRDGQDHYLGLKLGAA